jgi:hypothetical protein
MWNPSGATAALGYLMEGGPPPGFSNLALYGCATSAANSLGITVQVENVTSTGTFTSGSASYTDEQGNMWMTTGPFEIDITRLDGVGGMIQATLTTSIVDPPSQVAQSLSATFAVCHIEDQLAP